MSTARKAGYLNPSLYSSDDEDDEEDKVLSSSDEGDSIKKAGENTRTRLPKRKSSADTYEEKKNPSKKKKRTEAEDTSDDNVSSEEENSNPPPGSNSDESISSEEISEDNISDSDYMPDSEEEKNDTINISSGGETPTKVMEKKKDTISKTVDSNSEEFWSQVEKMRNHGLSIQQKSQQKVENKQQATPLNSVKTVLKPPPKPPSPPKPKLAIYTQLCINFEHEKRCTKNCFMMELNQRRTLAEICEPTFVSHDFVKACIGIITCCIRLSDLKMAREAIRLVTRLGEIRGVSTVCQAMISGVRVQSDTLDQMARLEENAIDAFRNKQLNKALQYIDKALSHAAGCIRLMMARGDCLVHLGKFVEAAKAVGAILQKEDTHVGALFLKGFCFYHKNSIDKAMNNFQQVLQLNKEHQRAKLLLTRAKLFKEKKDLAIKAMKKTRLEDAEKFLSDAILIDPRNKEVTAEFLAERAEVYHRMKKVTECVRDCDAAIVLHPSCSAAQLLRAKCHMESKEWGEAVKIYERMNNEDRLDQQNKKKAGDEALKSNKHDEAFQFYSEAQEVDRRNGRYRHFLREAKQQFMLITRVDYYAVLGIEKTAGDSDLKKAYFKKSKEYHPDRHANAEDAKKEEFSNKFKLAKEAYEVLSDMEKRKIYDIGIVKPPPGGWYRDLDKRIFRGLKPRGAAGVGGRGQVRGGSVVRGAPVLRGGSIVINSSVNVSVGRGNQNVQGSQQQRRGVVPRGGRGGPAVGRGIPRGASRPVRPGSPKDQKQTRARVTRSKMPS